MCVRTSGVLLGGGALGEEVVDGSVGGALLDGLLDARGVLAGGAGGAGDAAGGTGKGGGAEHGEVVGCGQSGEWRGEDEDEDEVDDAERAVRPSSGRVGAAAAPGDDELRPGWESGVAGDKTRVAVRVGL